ncbi:MAG: sugar ABC transporter substrate-binding protein [Planctomycetaceae bacterium]|nr:sugar ABC transporter substrate-binding protein [Planctomycetaceae bacterium]
MIENMVTNGVNVLLIAPTLMDTVRGPLESAVDRGVKVIFVDYSDYEAFPKVTTCVGTGNYEAARTIADFFVKNFFPDPKNTRVAIVRGMLGVESHELRTRGFTEILNAAGVQILDVQDADSNADKAATYVENWIQKYGVDGIDAIMSGSDPMTLGILSAVENADALGKIKIHGFDGFQAVIQAVGEGKITFSGAQKPYKIGYDAVMRGLDAMQGKPVEKYYDPGVDLITRENYKDFLN